MELHAVREGDAEGGLCLGLVGEHGHPACEYPPAETQSLTL